MGAESKRGGNEQSAGENKSPPPEGQPQIGTGAGNLAGTPPPAPKAGGWGCATKLLLFWAVGIMLAVAISFQHRRANPQQYHTATPPTQGEATDYPTLEVPRTPPPRDDPEAWASWTRDGSHLVFAARAMLESLNKGHVPDARRKIVAASTLTSLRTSYDQDGNAKAGWMLAWMYKNGVGVPSDAKKAADYTEELGNMGYREAQYQMGLIYLYGEGRDVDTSVAHDYIRDSADRHYLQAMIYLFLQYNATGTVREGEDYRPTPTELADYAKAREFWRRNAIATGGADALARAMRRLAPGKALPPGSTPPQGTAGREVSVLAYMASLNVFSDGVQHPPAVAPHDEWARINSTAPHALSPEDLRKDGMMWLSVACARDYAPAIRQYAVEMFREGKTAEARESLKAWRNLAQNDAARTGVSSVSTGPEFLGFLLSSNMLAMLVLIIVFPFSLTFCAAAATGWLLARDVRRLAPPGAHWTQRARVLWGARSDRGLLLLLACMAPWRIALASPDFLHVPPLTLVLAAAAASMLGLAAGGSLFRRQAGLRPLSPLAWVGDTTVMLLVLWVVILTPPALIFVAPWLATPAWLPWTAAGVLAFAAANYFGLGLGILRILGLAWPASAGDSNPALARLPRLMDEAARRVGSRPRPVWVLRWSMANAFAFTGPQLLTVTTRLMEIAEDEEVIAILAHEFNHLDEPASVLWMRVLHGALVSLCVLGMAACIANALMMGSNLFILTTAVPLAVLVAVEYCFGSFSRRQEHLADERGRAADATSGNYATILEKIHEDAYIPAAFANNTQGGVGTHPDLHSRLTALGAEPAWPRPEPPIPSSFLRFLPMVAVLMLNIITYDLAATVLLLGGSGKG
ncbi:hypothetical protein DB346_14170 [Verrucomicrobia bacterium LW23]|nr:hypothetical protein DB346_14170 [Verrucomicrobia bacterium LW23]